MRKKIQSAFIVLLLLLIALPLAATAAVVGRFTMVTGQVDLLRQGKIPGLPAKVRDGVEPGDVVRTKSKSKAQLTMVDDSVITLAPESRLAVADFTYDPLRQERRAVLRLFRGLVHTVVTRVIQAEQPDFILETHTGGVGVRGTEWYTLLAPSFTNIYLVQGWLDVRSNVLALAAVVLPLHSMQFTRVPLGQQPRLPQPLTPAMLGMLKKFMETGVQDQRLLSGDFALPEDSAIPSELPASPEKSLQPTITPTLPAPIQTPVTPGPGPRPQ